MPNNRVCGHDAVHSISRFAIRIMRIQFLGTGGYHPNDRRHTACVMLPELGVLFDAGTSFFRVPERLKTDTVQIFVSHAHLDHIVGLTYFLVPLLHGTVRRARVYANGPTLDAVRGHLFDQRVFPVWPDYEYLDVSTADGLDVPGGMVTHHPLLSHPGGSTAYRLDLRGDARRPARSMAYVTDTMVDGTYTEFIRGVDLLIHECNFNDEMAEWCERTGHSHTSQVAELAGDAGVGRLMLIHVDPVLGSDDPLDIEVARAIFPQTELAEDLMEVEL
jgi:ribonuclease BN (tRNA processing enzyme)